VGCPIRRPRDQRSLASPPGFSQRAASFIASQCQGIHQMPFSRFTSRPAHSGKPTRTNPAPAANHRAAARLSHEDTLRGTPPPARPSRSRHNSLFTLQSTRRRSPGGPLCIFSEPWPRLSRAPASPGRAPAAAFRRRRNGGGGDRVRTDALLLAKQALSQLSYTPGVPEEPGVRSQGSGARSQASLVPGSWRLNGGPGRI
jgi:hypothetical protein